MRVSPLALMKYRPARVSPFSVMRMNVGTLPSVPKPASNACHSTPSSASAPTSTARRPGDRRPEAGGSAAGRRRLCRHATHRALRARTDNRLGMSPYGLGHVKERPEPSSGVAPGGPLQQQCPPSAQEVSP